MIIFCNIWRQRDRPQSRLSFQYPFEFNYFLVLIQLKHSTIHCDDSFQIRSSDINRCPTQLHGKQNLLLENCRNRFRWPSSRPFLRNVSRVCIKTNCSRVDVSFGGFFFFLSFFFPIGSFSLINKLSCALNLPEFFRCGLIVLENHHGMALDPPRHSATFNRHGR